ncbi:MAG: LLM class F420-dependent oxidoreductase [Antricoccus sp.]
MLSVSLGLWQDRPPSESLDVAQLVDELGYDRLWIGEMATYDAFALATAVGQSTKQVPLVIGPLAVAVRDPTMIAVGAASVANLTGRHVDIALGTSSPVVVEQWHGRSSAGRATTLRESIDGVRQLMGGAKIDLNGERLRLTGYRLRIATRPPELTIAAFGPRALDIAAQCADRLVINLVDVPLAARLVEQVQQRRAALGREPIAVSAWVCAAESDDQDAIEQLRRSIVGYLGAPGYSDMFRASGFGEVVDFAATRPHPRELFAAIPDNLVETISILGDQSAARIAQYQDAGIDEVVIVPACTDRSPAGRLTLQRVAALQKNRAIAANTAR